MLLPILTSLAWLCLVSQTPPPDPSGPSNLVLAPSVEQIVTGALTNKLLRFRSQPARSVKKIAKYLKNAHELDEFARLPISDRARALVKAAEQCSDLRLKDRATGLASEAALLVDQVEPQERALLLVNAARVFADLGKIEQAYDAEDRAIEAIADSGYPPMTGADLRTLKALIAQRPEEASLTERINIALAISQMRLRFRPPGQDAFRDAVDAAMKHSDN